MAASMREVPLNKSQADSKFCRLEAASNDISSRDPAEHPGICAQIAQLAAVAGMIVNANRAAAAGLLRWEIEAGFSTTKNLTRIVCFFGIARPGV